MMEDNRIERESARRVSRCVTELLRKQPFFGSLALRLPSRADPSRETLASDGREIRYSPRWVAESDAHAIEAAIARVVLGCALKHHTRRGERDPGRWQLASQLVTHALLEDAGFELPPDAEAWEGLSVEQAYDRLPESQDDNSDDPDGQPENGGDDGGDGANGNPGPGEAPSHDPSGTGEILDAPRPGDDDSSGDGVPTDISAQEQEWDEAMHQALSLAKAEGKVPGCVEVTVRGAHASALDWRTLLRRYMTDAARRDYSWNRPNMRFIDSGLYLPSMHSEGIETIAVIVDTSGSLPEGTLADFWTQLREVATDLEPERVVVIQVDNQVKKTDEYTAFDLPDEIEVKGRGGTDFRPGFAWLDEQGIRPGVCLYFTDMECSFYPDREPDYPVIWCNWGDPDDDEDLQPWGERIDIS